MALAETETEKDIKVNIEVQLKANSTAATSGQRPLSFFARNDSICWARCGDQRIPTDSSV